MLDAVGAELMELRINEVYDRPTVQGEGPHVGRVCTFVRLYGCNLHCAWCDTPYTWDTLGRNGVAYSPRAESHKRDVQLVAAEVVSLGVPLVVVSGGEPLIQARGVVELARLLYATGIETHVETNGTLRPPADDGLVSHYSVSPKLPSAGAGDPELVWRPDVLALWAEHPRAIFKVVCTSADEVEDAFARMESLGVPAARQWVMPEGRTTAELEGSLSRIVDAALSLRMNISPRLHVSLWGTERGR